MDDLQTLTVTDPEPFPPEESKDSDQITKIDKILSELLTELNVIELERDEEILN